MRLPAMICVFVLSCFAFGGGDTEIKGHLVLNGGGKKPAVVMEKFIELAGGKDAAIVVIPTASELSDTGEYYRKLFERDYKCTNVKALEMHKPKHARKAAFVETLANASGIWFSGGDQRRITRVFQESAALEAIRDAYRRGAAVGGTSAGTACMSELMITGEGDWEVLRAKNIELWKGLGLFPKAILDQHFIARQRQNRLITVTLEHPEYFGIGVDEGTAVWLKPDQTFEVVGEGWVQIFDASNTIRPRHKRV